MDTTTTTMLARASMALGASVVLLAAVCYVRGVRRLRRSAVGRRHVGRPWALAAAVAITVVVAAPPVGELLEQRLSTHMAQHMVLIVVSGSLLALSGPGLPFLTGLPAPVRRTAVRLLRRLPVPWAVGPHLAWGLQIAALWLWHLPAAYDEAVAAPAAHLAEHASFLLTGWLFWWYLLSPSGRRLTGLPAVGYLVAAIPPGAALGALLTFSGSPLYPLQARIAASAGVDPLADQKLAGLVMWVPLDFAYVGLAVLILGRWFGDLQRRWPEPGYAPVERPSVGSTP